MLLHSLLLLDYSLPGRGTEEEAPRTSLDKPEPSEEAEWRSREGHLFSCFMCPGGKKQVGKYLKIYLRNVPSQLEIQGYLHTHRGERLPCTLLRINPPLGKSPDASCHVNTYCTHKRVLAGLLFLLAL